MKVFLYPVMIHRSMETKLATEVSRHEAEVLLAVHGSERVTLESEEPTGSMEIESLAEEQQRLRHKYGYKSADVLWVDSVYPNGTAFKNAVEAGLATEDKPKTTRSKAKAEDTDATAV